MGQAAGTVIRRLLQILLLVLAAVALSGWPCGASRADGSGAGTDTGGDADVTRLSDKLASLRVDPFMEVLEDPSGTLGIEEVSSGVAADGFKPLGQPLANAGRSQSAFWVRLRLHNSNPDWRNYFLVVEWPRLAEVDFYWERQPGTFVHEHSGFRVPFEQRAVPFAFHAVRFSISGFETRTVWYRVRSDSEVLFSTRVQTPAAFEMRQHAFLLGQGVYYGMLLALGLYNLLLFLRLRRAYYGLYLGVIGSFGTVWFLNSGFLGMWPWLAESGFRVEMLLANLWIFFRLAFTRSFLHVRQLSPVTDRVLAVLQWGVVPCWAVLGLFWFPTLTETWGALLSFCLVSVTLIPGVQARRANVRMARWFVEATTLLAAGMFTSVLVFAGLSVHPAFAGVAIMLATLLELFVLSLALSERVRSLIEQREQALRQVQSERLDSLQGIVGGVTHELNSPLGSLRSTADSLARVGARLSADGCQDRSPEATRALKALPQLVAVSQAATERISAVVRALHDFSQVDSAEEGQLDLRAGIDSALVLLRSSLDRIEVAVDYGDVPPLHCRPAEINQVLMAVLKNAVEAMPDGGQLAVETRRRRGVADVIISDTGVGIPAALRSRIFEPSISRSGGRVRMALGLSTSKRIIDAHQGSIAISPNQGAPGTRVAITLPCP